MAGYWVADSIYDISFWGIWHSGGYWFWWFVHDFEDVKNSSLFSPPNNTDPTEGTAWVRTGPDEFGFVTTAGLYCPSYKYWRLKNTSGRESWLHNGTYPVPMGTQMVGGQEVITGFLEGQYSLNTNNTQSTIEISNKRVSFRWVGFADPPSGPVSVPNFVGIPVEYVGYILEATGLMLGSIDYFPNTDMSYQDPPVGSGPRVYQQSHESGQMVAEGTAISFLAYEYAVAPPVPINPTPIHNKRNISRNLNYLQWELYWPS
jgi:hypothetical protein